MERHETVLLTPMFSFLHETGTSNTMQLIFHNIQSFCLHKDQIAGDQCYVSSDFILLAETWTLSSDVLKISSFFTPVSRVDCPNSRPRAYGCWCLVKNELL